jgi:hypothetical protein
MKTKKWIIILILAVVIVTGILVVRNLVSHPSYKEIFSGAVPQALEKEIPDGLSLTIDGKVKQTITLTDKAFRLMSKTRFRTPEITPEGEIMGTYIYTGIPVIYILEGVQAEKTKTDAFDRALDMIVVFTSAEGQTVRFSYGELYMANDNQPVTLAYHREPLKPSKSPESYTRNKYKEDITGLRLVCPREHDTSRYLDNVVRMTLILPPVPDNFLPRTQKNKNCSSTSITCINEGKLTPASYEGIPVVNYIDWFRVGHGRGIKGDRLATASGFHLRSFLKQNFPGCTPDDFFLFVGCDGYRSIFSGKEIFGTEEGNSFMLIDTIDGTSEKNENGYTIGAVTDFFVDRCVKSLTHIVYLKSENK